MGIFSRSAMVDGWKIRMSSRVHASLKKGPVKVLVALETMADGRSVHLYPSDSQFVRGAESDVSMAELVDAATRGLQKLGYRVTCCD